MERIYPTIEQRYPAPRLLVPAFYLLFASTPLAKTAAARFSIFILLVTLAVSSPAFHDKTLNDDYGRGLPSFTLPILFVDLFLLSLPGTIKFIGSLGANAAMNEGISENDCDTLWRKFKWGFRMVTTSRGIGWNWQVKGVPPHPDRDLSRRDFTIKYFVLALSSWLYKMAFHYLIGFATAVEHNTSSPYAHQACKLVIGWCGALWGCFGLNNFYQLGAAIGVAVGLSDPWEWPPFFGSLSDGWSVRQIWSSVWHQLLRRVFQEPGVRLVRLLGLPKGSLGSRYIQLYLAFTISMLLHKWCMFNATHADAGEFLFFMAQPLAITFEDFVQYCWRKSGYSETYPAFARGIGFVWMFAWFSYCLPPFVDAQRAVGIMEGDMGRERAVDTGGRHAKMLLQLFSRS